MIEYDSDVMFASPAGIRIMRWQGQIPEAIISPQHNYLLIPLQFDDCEPTMKLYETPFLSYPAQVTK